MDDWKLKARCVVKLETTPNMFVSLFTCGNFHHPYFTVTILYPYHNLPYPYCYHDPTPTLPLSYSYLYYYYYYYYCDESHIFDKPQE